MITVFKYPLEPIDSQILDLPVGAKILTAQLQYGQLCLWCEIDTTQPVFPRIFRIYGTGHAIILPDVGSGLKYIATAQDLNGVLVWHVYEVILSP